MRPRRPGSRDRVLVLGGTGEARRLAGQLHAAGVPVTTSLAGRLAAPRRPGGDVRSGGFGGVAGLVKYLWDNDFRAVVDATHPFAAGITGNAAAACARTGLPLLVLRRPAWTPEPADRWVPVADLDAAAAAVPVVAGEGGRVLLTTGRQGASVFAGLARQRFWLRAIEAPDPPLPPRCEILLARGPFALDDELALFRRLELDLVVSKNSGGEMTAAKLVAARRLHLPVIMVERPPLPDAVIHAPDVEAALAWLGV